MQARRDGQLVRERELKGGAAQTTNNRMEMTAAIEALNALKSPSRIRIVTDSTYLRDGITKWLHGWKRKGWKTAARKPVKNAAGSVGCSGGGGQQTPVNGLQARSSSHSGVPVRQ